MIAYWNGAFVDHERVHVSPNDRGFLFADGVYEVIRAYRGRPYAVTEHAERLRASMSAVRMAWPGATGLGTIVARLLEANGLASSDALVYLQVTRGVAPRRHAFPGEGTPVTVYAAAWQYEPSADAALGVEAILVPDTRWARCDIKSIGLLPNVMARQQAVDAGANEAIFVRQGVLTEGSRTNVAAVIDGQLVTHPLSHHVLPGITRATVLALCESLGIPCRESPVVYTDLERASELMLMGTTMEIMPVVRLHGHPIGGGVPGPVALQLAEAYRREVCG